MKQLHKFISATALLSVPLFLLGCGQNPNASPKAAVEKPKSESELAYVTVSKKAQKSLLIETALIRTEMAQEQLQLTGWIMAPQGSEVTLTAPVGGYILESKELQGSPWEGLTVPKNKELFRIKPVLSPVEQIQIDTLKRGAAAELTKAIKSLDVAKKDLDRITGLHKQGLRSQKDLENAGERFTHAKEDLQAAEDKQIFFLPRPAPIKAPLSGTVLTVLVSPGQYVPTSAPLITLADLRRLWVRVPIPEFDVPAIDPKKPARISVKSKNIDGKSIKAGAAVFSVKPIALVPKVDALRHTVDMIYELSPDSVKGATFVKDQMVSVFIPTGPKSSQSVVPPSAVVYDIHGNGWIYLDRTKKNSTSCLYERRRVQVGPTVNGQAVIQPPAGEDDRVVTKGAGVLFSREFYSPPVR